MAGRSEKSRQAGPYHSTPVRRGSQGGDAEGRHRSPWRAARRGNVFGEEMSRVSLPRPSADMLYARVSTKDKGQDTENQLDQLRDFCAKQDWTVTHEYVDHVSGKTADKRPQFQAMFAAASRHEFDMVLFWSLDRFSREGVLRSEEHTSEL